MIARRAARYALAPILILAMLGCSSNPDELPRVPVEGTVTMDGKPLPAGVIQFSPAGEVTATSAPANGEIKDGKFSIPRQAGPVPGTYKVTISHAELKSAAAVAKGRARKTVSERSLVLGPEQIPARYSSLASTELKAEIKPGGARDLKFDLQSK